MWLVHLMALMVVASLFLSMVSSPGR